MARQKLADDVTVFTSCFGSVVGVGVLLNMEGIV